MLNSSHLLQRILRTMPFYAVRQGRNTGIFSDWDSCRDQVNGFCGAQFKKFNSEEAAMRFMSGDNTGTGYGRQQSYQRSESVEYDSYGGYSCDSSGHSEDYSSGGSYSGGYSSGSSYSGGYSSGSSYSGGYSGGNSYSSSYNSGGSYSGSYRSSGTSNNRYHPYRGGNTTYTGTVSVSVGDNDMTSTIHSLRNGISNLATQVKALNQQINRIEQNKNQGRGRNTVRHYSTNSSTNGTSSSSGSTSRHAEVYTDGSCIDNGRGGARAGIGVYWGNNNPNNVAERLSGRQTNNRAEIHAARKAINQAKDLGYNSITVKTDSQFLINSVTQWMPNWKQNGWRLSNRQPVKNKTDFEELDRDMQDINVKWVHVRGHQGEQGNEAADRLANEGAARPH